MVNGGGVSFITLYLAYGFWKLQKAAWVTFFILNCYGLILGVINFFTFDLKVLNKMMPADYPESFGLNPVFFRAMAVLGLILSVGLMVYVFSKKGLFFKDNSSSEPEIPTEG